jgi:hypothetical protein
MYQKNSNCMFAENIVPILKFVTMVSTIEFGSSVNATKKVAVEYTGIHVSEIVENDISLHTHAAKGQERKHNTNNFEASPFMDKDVSCDSTIHSSEEKDNNSSNSI